MATDAAGITGFAPARDVPSLVREMDAIIAEMNALATGPARLDPEARSVRLSGAIARLAALLAENVAHIQPRELCPALRRN